ncbi:MAG: endonuclease/exonuclease/phosphatase family protein [Sphingobacteriales bacterium]|nr:endonuclease/exonuclease/phosphatase family protein [Sphingobacteriales bacterium]
MITKLRRWLLSLVFLTPVLLVIVALATEPPAFLPQEIRQLLQNIRTFIDDYRNAPVTSSSESSDPIPAEQKPVKKAFNLVSWNVCNFGKSKDDAEIDFMASLLKSYDIIALQEINVSSDGAQGVARLAEALNNKGGDWDYTISDPTEGKGTSERYAYIWKQSKVKLYNKAMLVKPFERTIAREPYMARFQVGSKDLLLINFHAVPPEKQPENEIMQLYRIQETYPVDNVVFLGDFNLDAHHDAFTQIHNEFSPALLGQKTSLKSKYAENDYLSEPYDNIFYEKQIMKALRSGVIDFVKNFKDYEKARNISDHLPVWVDLGWK